uniref:GRF-type domain-containing protein n=1 Tax=Triticum urartu TaxID=4572 RepID=A0A8R7K0P7_TRIUA
MASSASSSSRARSSSRRVISGQVRSPVRYREGPLDYEPFTPCDCREKPKAAMWISWSDENPGRRYKTCYRARRGGCDFYQWHDDPITNPFLKQLVIDLRDQVWLLERTNAVLQDA